MPDHPRIGQVSQAVGVSGDTLRRWEAAGRVTFQRRGNQRMLPADRLAELMDTRRPAAGTSSARNRMRGTVVHVERDGVMAKVEIARGDHRIVSLISRESADELGLEVGSAAVAVVKASNVIVESA